MAGQGVLHSSSGGVISSKPRHTGADIANATVTNANLITLSTPGLVSNAATTATPLNTASAIVSRDGSNNFAARYHHRKFDEALRRSTCC